MIQTCGVLASGVSMLRVTKKYNNYNVVVTLAGLKFNADSILVTNMVPFRPF